MKITKQEALSIAKGLSLHPIRMEEITVYCAKNGSDTLTMGRHGVYFALGDAFNVSIARQIIETLPSDDSQFDISGYKNTITSEVAFAALRAHLPRYDAKRVVTLLNTSIITAEGTHSLKKVSLEEACKLVTGAVINSAIGHEATAKIMDTLLGIEVPVNRQAYQSKPGDVALVFKLKGRPPEGKILTVEEMNAIGYEFFVLTHLPTDDLKAKIRALVDRQMANGSADSAALTLTAIGDLLST